MNEKNAVPKQILIYSSGVWSVVWPVWRLQDQYILQEDGTGLICSCYAAAAADNDDDALTLYLLDIATT
jgi:hypothetical protein